MDNESKQTHQKTLLVMRKMVPLCFIEVVFAD